MPPAWQARHGLTNAQYQTAFNELAGQGYQLIQVSGYSINNVDLYAGIWEQRSNGVGWEARHGITNAQYQAAFDDLVLRGFRLMSVSGYQLNGVDYYAGMWEQTIEPFSDLPMTGNAVPELAVFDQAMRDFMVARQITAGTLAIMRDGEIVFERGYGWQDRARTVPMPPDAMLRLASVVKPITAAAIRKLIAEDKLEADDRVFCLTGSPSNCILNITPFGTEDANVVNITVQHLLDHKGGWDRDVSGDPMFDVIDIADELEVTLPPTKTDIVRYMLGRPLDFVPGTDDAYSNFGYLLLGLIVEDITGYTFTSYVQRKIFEPLCVPRRDVELSRSLPANRNVREPWYAHAGTATSVFDSSQTVMFPDGGFYAEGMEAHGGLTASASAIAKFLEGYWISGEPRSGDGQDWTFYGSLPGTWTMARQRTDGVNIVALFNQRTEPPSTSDEQIRTLLDNAVDSITTWPAAASAAQQPLHVDGAQQVSCLFAAETIRVSPIGAIFNALDAKTSVHFPENAITAPISVTLTPKRLTVGNDFQSIDHFFALTAVDDNQQPVTTFLNPLTIVTELPDDLGGLAPNRFKLYWQDGNTWSTEGLSTVSLDGNTLTSTTTHFTTFAVLAEADPDPDPTFDNALFLPNIQP